MTASVLKQDPNTLCARAKISKRSFEPFCVCMLSARPARLTPDLVNLLRSSSDTRMLEIQ